MSPAQIHPSVEISRQMRKLFPPGKQAGPAHLSQAWMRARTPSRYPAMFPQRSQAKNNRRKKKALRRKPMKTTRPKCRRPRLLIITTQRQTMRNQKAKSITKTQNQASLAKAPQINNGILESIANTLMKAFLSDSPKSVNETYSSAAEKKENFYVGGQSYSSKLTASDVTSATCKKSGSNYVVTLKVKGSSVSKAFSTISKNQITDAVKGMVKFNSIDISYSDSTIQATVGPQWETAKSLLRYACRYHEF